MAKMTVRRKLAIAAYDAPREGNIYGKLVVDAGPGLRYLEEVRKKTGEKVSFTHLVGRAVAEALKQAPTLNGRIVFGSFEPFPTVDIAFLVALEDGQDRARAKICEVEKKSVAQIASELSSKCGKLRNASDEAYEKSKQAIRTMPTWLLKPMLNFTGFLASSLGLNIPALGVEPFPFGSCIVTSVGMFGLEEGFVPPTPFTRVPVYILVGAVKERPAVIDGKIQIQPQLTLIVTIDHRFIDGAQLAVLVKVVRSVLENPYQLDEQKA